jgi:hypothetical protein
MAYRTFLIVFLPSWIRIRRLHLKRIHPDPKPCLQPCFLLALYVAKCGLISLKNKNCLFISVS